MDSRTGQLYPRLADAFNAGVPADALVEVHGDPATVERLSLDIGKLRELERRRAKNKLARRTRAKNRRG